MSPVVKKLPVLVAARVAAAEVITRPVNVVKELVENSIDAGATQIRVSIQGGGKHFIEVWDDGVGMVAEDLLLSLQKHATSKIFSLEDLNHLDSFGFRGEALPSIAAVARLQIESRYKGSECAYLASQSGVEASEVQVSSLSSGTKVTVRDLFYNIPARLKFLKSEKYEKSLIEELIQNFIAATPNISFELKSHQERVLYHSGLGGDEEMLQSIYGAATASRMVELTPKKHPILGFITRGYAGLPDLCRSDTSQLRFFVNRRIVNHPGLRRMIRMAYDSLSETKKWPVGLYWIEIPPRMLDVNIHPQKTEIRIENEVLLNEFLLKNVRQLLLSQDLSPRMQLGTTIQKLSSIETSFEPTLDPDMPRTLYSQSPLLPKEPPAEKVTTQTLAKQVGSLKIQIPEELNLAIEKPKVSRLDKFRVVGQLKKTLILCESGEDMMVIDQHIAQERVLFDQCYLALCDPGKNLQTQKLLSPLRFSGTASELSLVEEHRQSLLSVGIDCRVEGLELLVFGYPQELSTGIDREFIQKLLSSLEKNQVSSVMEDYFREIASALACRGSIKAGMELTLAEMQRLVDDLSYSANPYFCPHGRPVIVKISVKELLSRFHRYE